jgi:hypothetical protein
MQRSLDRFSPKNTKAGRIHRSTTTWDWFSPKNTRPVGYINHQQQTTIFHMINQQVSPENRNWKLRRSIAEDLPENAELRRSFKTGWKQTERAGST